jgi:hypothetical protein
MARSDGRSSTLLTSSVTEIVTASIIRSSSRRHRLLDLNPDIMLLSVVAKGNAFPTRPSISLVVVEERQVGHICYVLS